jgi:hypothetical protein
MSSPPIPRAPYGQGIAPSAPSAWAALRFVFADANWFVNSLVGVLLTLIPVVGALALLGWGAEIAQRLSRNHPRPVPKLELADLGHYLGRGLHPFLVGMIVRLPVALVAVALSSATVLVTLSVASATDKVLVVGSVGLALSLATVALVLFLGIVASSALAVAELTESVPATFVAHRLGTFLRRTAAAQILQGALFALLTLGLLLAGWLLCFVGIYPVVVLVQVAQVHLRWQMYRHYLAEGGEPFPIPAPRALPSEPGAAFAGAPSP